VGDSDEWWLWMFEVCCWWYMVSVCRGYLVVEDSREYGKNLASISLVVRCSGVFCMVLDLRGVPGHSHRIAVLDLIAGRQCG